MIVFDVVRKAKSKSIEICFFDSTNITIIFKILLNFVVLLAKKGKSIDDYSENYVEYTNLYNTFEAKVVD